MIVISSALALYGVIRGHRAQPTPDHKAGPTEIVVEAGEKDGLMEGEEHVDAPPSYMDEPAVPRT
ncbi:hypothetical protein IMZ48_23125 [Candidatus Bathyarchaeota archaeon]|nr:hypothetical protein [Candidatus Bathyarchaeota archaeon]